MKDLEEGTAQTYARGVLARAIIKRRPLTCAHNSWGLAGTGGVAACPSLPLHIQNPHSTCAPNPPRVAEAFPPDEDLQRSIQDDMAFLAAAADAARTSAPMLLGTCYREEVSCWAGQQAWQFG